MDFRLEEGAEWKRIKPSQARTANKKRSNKTRNIDEGELMNLLGERGGSDSE